MALRVTAQAPKAPLLVIHGGAGNITPQNLSPEEELSCRMELKRALETGWKILQNGGSSLEAVVTAISILEDSPHFNAGKGSVLNRAGKVELDASIMEGKTGMAGAVAAVTRIKNPIQAAVLVMQKTPHVLLIGKGAHKLAKKNGLELVPNSYFITPKQKKVFQKLKSKAQKQKKDGRVSERKFPSQPEIKGGTVGAVALDKEGNLAAGTSTGGMAYKMQGRVGDTPIIGASTWAENNLCAVSTTGHGEYFIRGVVAYDIAALMRYQKLSLSQATQNVIQKLTEKGGQGGIIAIDSEGNIAMPFNTPGMFRGYIRNGGELNIEIFADE
ncbi:MAG: isoaspartyl peptidase/L-asparaginase [Bacteroidia bacterium]|nr:isoaspartyl peptidase/L-asparaginase [Bacteroidia bacterium]MDW8158697.1 isoaspartyl peptidase/L-asparaginase [Bacteroidia bacterium]